MFLFTVAHGAGAPPPESWVPEDDAPKGKAESLPLGFLCGPEPPF